MKCKCGNNKFIGHQILRVDVMVDEDGEFLNNLNPDNKIMDDCYDNETPYGPFTCTECSQEYKKL